MHPNYEQFRVPSSERVQFNTRLPKELVAQLKVLASLENDEVQNLTAEAVARLIEARQQEPLVDKITVQKRINELDEELSVLHNISTGLETNS